MVINLLIVTHVLIMHVIIFSRWDVSTEVYELFD